VLRRPASILHPQFWAEDGLDWYQEAYLFGTHCLFIPHTGYLQTISRMAAIFSIYFPILYAPLIFALISLAAQVSPIAVFLSERFDYLVPNIKLRLFISLCYVLIPNSYEINMNLAGAQWHIAILSFLLIVGREPKQFYVRMMDYPALAIFGLSGPYSIFLSPIALFEWFKGRTIEKSMKAFVVSTTAVIQLVVLTLCTGSSRSNAPLGASVKSFFQILGNQIFAGGIVGNVETMGKIGLWLHYLNYVGVPIAIILIVIAMARGPVIYREFIFLAFTILGSALIRPLASLTEPQWPVMKNLGIGDRYYVLPIIAWIMTLIILSLKGNKLTKYISRFLIAMMFILVPFNFSFAKYADTDFDKEALEFEQALPGQKVTFQENPPGWDFTLIKK
jgi:hypothetical protein